jgi:MFS family permease
MEAGMTAVVEPETSRGALINEKRPPSLWRDGFAVTSIGVFALTFMLAFEALAVSTVMPEVAAALGGTSWYALAFAAPAAVSVVALTLAGPWMDRNGPRGAVYVGAGVFASGLVSAGLAVSMPMFLLGRGLQGFGGGVIGVGIAVLIARVYPEELRPRMFALLTGALVLPGLVGPVIAAAIAAAFGWRWVFLGVPALAFIAVGLLTRALPDFGQISVHSIAV